MKDTYTLHALNAFVNELHFFEDPCAIEYEVAKNGDLVGTFVIFYNNKTKKRRIAIDRTTIDKSELTKCLRQNKDLLTKNFETLVERGEQIVKSGDAIEIPITKEEGEELLDVAHGIEYQPKDPKKDIVQYVIRLEQFIHLLYTAPNKYFSTTRHSLTGKNNCHVKLIGKHTIESGKINVCQYLGDIKGGEYTIKFWNSPYCEGGSEERQAENTYRKIAQKYNICKELENWNSLPMINSH